jgi:hypothetical protein
MHTDKLKYKELTHLIIKGFHEVYTELGGGFLESVFENAMTLNSISNLFNLCQSVAE